MFSVAHIDAYMGAGLARIAAGIIEKHQVTGLQSINAPYLGADTALPLAGSRVGERISHLAVDVHRKTGAVKAAGGSAAVRIAGAQILLGKRDNVTRGGAGVGQHQEIAADISLRTVFTGDIVPAVHKTVNCDHGAVIDGGQRTAARP